MAELGLLAAAIPAEAGGFAEGIEEALVVMEEFGRRLVVEPFSETAIVAGTLIAKLGTAAQRSDLLPPIMAGDAIWALAHEERSEEHTSELQTLMRISYAVFCLKTKNNAHGRTPGMASPSLTTPQQSL